MTKTIQVLVTVEVADTVTKTEFKDYVKTAVNQWSSGGDPEDHLNSIKVKSVRTAEFQEIKRDIFLVGVK